MGRAKGSRNKDFESSRREIAASVVRHALDAPGEIPSFRELARIADVTPNALRHYFPSRDAVLVAALAESRREGEVHLERAAGAGAATPPLARSLREYLEHFVMGFTFGVGHLIAFGLGAGLSNVAVGPAFVDSILEPTLAALESRLALHAARGELKPCDLRLAALSLLSPVLMGLIHQQPLGGSTCRPLDITKVAEEQVRVFVMAYGEVPSRDAAPRPSPPKTTKAPPARRPRTSRRGGD